MSQTPSGKTSLDESLKKAQLKKLRLEIKHLRQSGWGEVITQSLPVISVLIAVAGFIFGIYQFKTQSQIENDKLVAEQQKDRETKEIDQALRVQSQIRSDLEQLYMFPQEEKGTISRVRFLIADLKDYLEIETKLNQSVAKQHKQRDITVNLIQSIVNDCNFDRARDVNFARTLMSDWKDCRWYLTEQPDRSNYISSMYLTALDKFYRKDPSAIRNMSFDEVFDWESRKISEPQKPQVEDLISGFKEHVQLFEAGELKNGYIKDFEATVCNPKLTEQLFGVRFDPKDIPKISNCPQAR